MADKNSFDFKDMHLKDIPAFAVNKIKGGSKNAEMVTGQTGKYEVNLVPAVKLQMIKLQKTRNLVFFVCLVISIVCGISVAVLGSVKAGQDIALAVQDGHIEKLSNKLLGYGELSEFLTIQTQLSKLTEIEDQKKVLSRVFSILNVMMPNKDDTVKLSELSVNLEEYTLTFEGQADAGKEPFIDYRVLEAFKKQVSMMKFDYGRYVDADNREIPTRCIIETDLEGNMLTDKGSIYVIWTRGKTGCDPGREDFSVDDDGNTVKADYTFDGNTSSSLDNTTYNGSNSGIGSISGGELEELEEGEKDMADGGEIVVKPNAKVIDIVPNEKIYRTPQFNAWHTGERVMTAEDGIDDDVNQKAENQTKDDEVVRNVKSYIYTPSMTLTTYDDKGAAKPSVISGVPHFESQCTSYFGDLDQETDTVRWSAENKCMLESEPAVIQNSSNGLDSSQNLVLQFTATLTLDHAVFAYRNKHMMIVSPTNQNVTDSYTQVKDMFTAPATDCSKTDNSKCDNKTNAGE